MRKMHKFTSLILAILLVFTACSLNAPVEPPENSQGSVSTEGSTISTEGSTLGNPQLDSVLLQRRDAAEAQMRQMMTLLWRADKSFTYSKNAASKGLAADSASNKIQIVEGRVYRGLPYTHGSSSLYNFTSYGEPGSDGVYNLSGISTANLSGGCSTNTNNHSRLGNDCADAVFWSWATVASSITFPYTQRMTKQFGCLPVGDYTVDGIVLSGMYNDTKVVTQANGEAVMYESYALLQKADAVVFYNSSGGHAMMIVTNNVVRASDGSIDPEQSYVTVLEQTSKYMLKDTCEYNSTLGEDVYCCGGVDVKYTYKKLFSVTYLPVTCKELIDPSPLAEEFVNDSETNCSVDTLFTGTFTASYRISSVTITITDSNGVEVQKLIGYGRELEMYAFDLARLASALEKEVMQGSIDLSALSPGTYRCTYHCQLSTGNTFTVRDFTFSV